jgi:hypothetical protein
VSSRFPPGQLWAEALLELSGDFSGLRHVPNFGLVEYQLPIQGHLENTFDTRTKLDSLEHRRPSVTDFSRHTDGRVEMISRNAVFDDREVLWVDQAFDLLSNDFQVRASPSGREYPTTRVDRPADALGEVLV